MRTVQPRQPWEVPVASYLLISAALARGRPQAVQSIRERRGGGDEATVVSRYNDLMAVIERAPWVTDDALARLRSLEAEGPEARPPLWESVVMSSGAADDDRVIEASRRVWEALGPNAYNVQFRARPRTWRGFIEGRSWLVVGVAGLVALVILTDEVNQRGGWYWLVVIPFLIAWPALLYMAFSRRYRRLEERGGKELPHF
ncbi:hypothetical protein ASG78_00240 [Nostocoides sp. Soil756]|nr:hypothetical protein ASG78_00240 [Tetrasphaera sp. Soil756]